MKLQDEMALAGADRTIVNAGVGGHGKRTVLRAESRALSRRAEVAAPPMQESVRQPGAESSVGTLRLGP